MVFDHTGSTMSDIQNGGLGLADASSSAPGYNEQSFLIWSILKSISGAKLVEVISCTNSGGVSPVGFVNVRPLVNQLDGYGNAVPHGQIFNLPFFRVQGGTNAVICDPAPGDIGLAIVEDRDISAVKNTKAQANPGSRRAFDLSDGLFIGGFLNGTPTQYVQFSSSGITIVTPGDVNIQAAGNINATAQGNASVSAQGTATISGTAGVNINSPASVEISGSAGVSITTNGNATATINGSMTATATGPVSLSAPTISLN
jgi:hypothetical protein